ncbi:HdeD family acid-resistance protein [Muricoccus vinaceus]|uniref:HdeD family acid-resistance protein n=1 Tax=Muricoccus vinaceus TaxID=424704 RepID=A0ABV6J2W1_9PROT
MSIAMHPAPEGRFRMIRALANGWWLLLLRGIVSILFGIFAFMAPGLGLVVILGTLAAWLALDGAFTLWQAVTGRPAMLGVRRPGTGWLWLEGLASLVAAAVLLMMPIASAIVLVLLVGAWSMAAGVFRAVLGWRSGSWMLGLSGLLSILVGLWLVAAPGPGLLALIWLVAIQAVVGGGLLAGLAVRLRRVHNDPTPG